MLFEEIQSEVKGEGIPHILTFQQLDRGLICQDVPNRHHLTDREYPGTIFISAHRAKLKLTETDEAEAGCVDEPVGFQASYLILKLLRPLSVSRNRREVVRPFVVILVHCVERMAAAGGEGKRKRDDGKRKEAGVNDILKFESLSLEDKGFVKSVHRGVNPGF